MNFERFQPLGNFRRACVVRYVDAEHRLFIVGDQSLHFDVPQSSGRKQTSGQFQNARQRFFVAQFINCGTSNHAFDRHLRPDRRHLNCIPIFESLDICLHPMEQEIVDIDGLNELIATIVVKNPQRSSNGWPTGDE